MKKILLSLIMVLAGFATLSATTTTIDFTTGYTNEEVVTSASKDGITVTLGKGTNTSNEPKWYTSGTAVRAYKQNAINISSTAGNISSVVFTFVSNTYTLGAGFTGGASTFSVGKYSEAEAVGTWTGDAAAIDIVCGGTTATKGGTRIQKIEVTFGGVVTQVATPTFSPKGGTYYEAQTVTLSCPTEGATIKYSIDGGSGITYSAPIAVNESCTIKAFATKDGLDKSEYAEATYTISEMPKVANIAAFLALDKDAMAQITGPVTVYVHLAPNIFVKDDSGCLLVYGTVSETYKNGDVLTGITGKVAEYNGTKQMTPVAETFTTATKGTEVIPTTLKSNEITADMVNQYIIVKDATIALKEEGSRNFTLTDEAGSIAGYQSYKAVTLPTDGKAYDIKCIVTLFSGAAQVAPVEFTTVGGVNGVTVDNNTTIVPSIGTIEINTDQAAQAVVVNAAGQIVAQKAIVEGNNTITVAAGFYIVKVGTTVSKVIVK